MMQSPGRLASIQGKLKRVLGIQNTRPVFIIGTGRSGTHWLARTLQSHPEVLATIETQPMYGLSQQMAQNPTLEVELFGQLVSAYRRQIANASHQIYLDKSHSNIWISEKLKIAFPQALFIGTERNPYATVASMLRHKGVSAWHRRWREFPLPNRFLGIAADMADCYDSIPLASQCAMRWMAHKIRMDELRDSLGGDLLVISYESFQNDTDKILGELQRFLGLYQRLATPTIRRGSLQGWRSQLSDEEIFQIQNIVGFAPDYYCKK